LSGFGQTWPWTALIERGTDCFEKVKIMTANFWLTAVVKLCRSFGRRPANHSETVNGHFTAEPVRAAGLRFSFNTAIIQ
jgi:hypothetical protein